MAQAADLWSITVALAAKPSDELRYALEAALEGFGEALSSFETDGGRGWRIEVFAAARPDRKAVLAALKPYRGVKPVLAPVPPKDWVAESQRGLPPLAAGPFFIHGSHFAGKPPRGRIVLEIDAGMAFGTGRHETTRGCLLALSRLARTRRFKRPLDVGCGTGILAFAMAHLWGQPVLAADLDADAVRVSRENARLNGLGKRVKVVKSDGYRAAAIRAGAPYDVIAANILANPLIGLAPDLAAVLARDGRAVLSGLLRSQEKDVLAAHRAAGLELDFRLHLKEWSVLVLRRRGRTPQRKTAVRDADRRV